MSLVPFLRDYVDALNTAYDSLANHAVDLQSTTGRLHGDFSFLTVVQQTLVSLLKGLQYILLYLLTFQWIRDLSFLPIMLPQINLSLIRGNSFVEEPLSNVFTFLETPTYANNRFFVGFFNSFFASLPLSVAHLLSVRRLFIEGIPAGIASALGTVIGQCFFLLCILFGWRLLVLFPLSVEPISYVMGTLLVVTVLYRISQKRGLKIVHFSDRSTLLRFFLINLLLTWCEQTTLFQFLGNLTVNAEPALYSSANSTLSYLLGFFLGNVLLTAAIGYSLLLLHQFWLKQSGMTYSRSINRMNIALLNLILAFSLTSAPYYGLDFFIANTAGFAPQDQSLDSTWFYPAALPDTPAQLNEQDNPKATVDIDLHSFDRGHYMPDIFLEEQTLNPKDRQLHYEARKKSRRAVKEDAPASHASQDLDGEASSSQRTTKTTNKRPQKIEQGPLPLPHSFEALHFEAENAWVVRDWHQCHDTHTGGLLGRIVNPRISRLTSKMPKPPTRKRVSSPSHLDKNGEKSFDPSGFDSQEGLLPWDNDEALFNQTDPTLRGENRRGSLPNSKDLPKDLLKSGPTDRFEREELLQANFSSQFNLGFSPFFAMDASEQIQFPGEQFVKETYYSNPVFKALLTLDIDSFLSRQPTDHSLSANEEKRLFLKRQLLGRYYDTLRHYDDFSQTQDRSFYKSFTDRVYNQQFKGTLKVVRRLFSITLDPDQTPNQRQDSRQSTTERILKFDQPLFDKSPSKRDSLFHEELPINTIEKRADAQSRAAALDEASSEEDYETEHNGLDYTIDDSQEAESAGNVLERSDDTEELPFIEETDPIPFYAGWDDQLRKFVITNRVLGKSPLSCLS